MGEHAYDHSSSMSPSTPPAQHRGSSRHHTTVSSRASTRPAIKIIHIIPPEIIKTDAANFRDLVQRLTGRQHEQQPEDDEARTAGTVAMAPTPPSPVEEKPQKKRLALAPGLADDSVLQQENRGRKKIKCEAVKMEEGEFGFGGDAGELDLGELWMDLNPGGCLSFLEEDVFQFQGTMAPDFLQPTLCSSRMDLIGEMCASYLA